MNHQLVHKANGNGHGNSQGNGNGNGNGNGAGHRNGKTRHSAAPAGTASPDSGYTLITGGAGFIGTNLAHQLASSGAKVLLFDNLSRPGVEANLAWLKRVHGSRITHVRGDVRDRAALQQAVRAATQVFHFAAQVAVTTSLDDPLSDFEVNARGTLNLLEAIRACDNPPPLVFTSTNKVYGDLRDVRLRVRGGRYEPAGSEARHHGFSEERPLNFHSPYGCSKGAACQYVLDYARTFKLRTAVFRMSCIYGPHQFGTEDQGWVAHFLIKALDRQPITIYGDGRQVRDVLFVEDLVQAFLVAQQRMDRLSGQAFNIGGGPENTTSLLELMEMIGRLTGEPPTVRFADWRPADQQYYVSDVRKFFLATGWRPRINVQVGVAKLYHWLQEFRRDRAAASLASPRLARRRSTRLPRVRAPRSKTLPRARPLRRLLTATG